MKMRNPLRFPQHWSKGIGPVQIRWNKTSFHAELERELWIGVGKYSMLWNLRNDNKYGDNRKTLARSIKKRFRHSE